MADNEHGIDLVKVIKENFSAIQNDIYEWKVEEINAVYKLSQQILKDYKLHDNRYNRDLLQAMVFEFFTVVVKKIDINHEGNSSFIYNCLKNKLLEEIKKINKVDEKELPLLNKKLNDDLKEEESLNLIESNLDNQNEYYTKRVLKDYNEFIEKEMLNIPILKAFFIDKKSINEISEMYNLSSSVISTNISWEKEALILKGIEKGYMKEAIFSNDEVSEEYKYAENKIYKYGLLYTVYNLNNAPKDIASSLKMDAMSIKRAINNELNNKIKLLKKEGIDNANIYINILKDQYPELLYNIEKRDKNIFNFIDHWIENSDLLHQYYVDKKTLIEIGNLHNTNFSNISVMLKNEREALKLAIIEQGFAYNSKEIYSNNSYQNYKNKLEKYGLMDMVYAFGFTEEDISTNLNVSKESVRVLLKKQIRDIENSLKKRFGASADVYIRLIYDSLSENLSKINQMGENYFDTLNDIINNSDVLKHYYGESKKTSQICKELGKSSGWVSEHLEIEREAVKILLMEEGYTSSVVSNVVTKSDLYKYAEKLINNNGLIKLVYNLDNDIEDIASSLNIKAKSVEYAVLYLVEQKRKLLESKGVANSNVYIRFTQMYLPKLLNTIELRDEKYFDFVDEYISRNPILVEYFLNNKKPAEISLSLNTCLSNVHKILNTNKKSVVSTYKEYAKNNKKVKH